MGGVAAEGFKVACEGLRLEARGTRDSATGEAAGGAVLALDGLAIRDAEGRLVAETGPGGITNAIAVSTKAGRLDIAASGGAGWGGRAGCTWVRPDWRSSASI